MISNQIIDKLKARFYLEFDQGEGRWVTTDYERKRGEFVCKSLENLQYIEGVDTDKKAQEWLEKSKRV